MSLLVLDPALIGLSLVYIVSLNGMLQYAVRLSAEVENLVCHGAVWIPMRKETTGARRLKVE